MKYDKGVIVQLPEIWKLSLVALLLLTVLPALGSPQNGIQGPDSHHLPNIAFPGNLARWGNPIDSRDMVLGIPRRLDLLPTKAQASQPIDPAISPVVQIATFQGTTFLKAGSGTIIHASGLILTNYHVISDAPVHSACQNVQGKTPGSLFVILVTEQGKEDSPAVPQFTAVLAPGVADPAHDLALLQIDGQVSGNLKDLTALQRAVDGKTLQTGPLPADLKLPSLGLWDSSVLHKGRLLLAQGYPDKPKAGLPRLTHSRGPLFSLEPAAQPTSLFIDNLFTIPGISGGPLLDAQSQLVVGVMCGQQVPPEQGVSEALERGVLINLVAPLLEKAPKQVNRLPVAKFSWEPFNPKVGETVTFDGTRSYDSDGSIVHYAWGFNGDGTVDATGPQASFTVSSDRELNVTLTVTDNDGGSNSRVQRVILQRTSTCVASIKGQSFKRIQAAIEAAKVGETIQISAGQCQESLVIAGKKDLVLEGAGAGKTTLLGLGEVPVITIQSASQSITINGLSILDGLVGLEVVNSFGVIIQSNSIKENLRRGVELEGAQVPTKTGVAVKLLDNELSDNGEEGLTVQRSAVTAQGNRIARNRQGGILVQDTTLLPSAQFLEVLLQDNLLEENKLMGIAVARGASAQIQGGQIQGTQGNGLEIDSGFQAATVQEIDIAENEINGVTIKGHSKPVIISNALIASNRYSGVQVEDEAQVSLDSNSQVSHNLSGLLVTDTASVSLFNSTIFRNSENCIAPSVSLCAGLFLSGSAQATLTESTVSENCIYSYLAYCAGLFLTGSAKATLKDSTVSLNGPEGLWLLENAQATLSNSTVSDHMFGLVLYDSAKATLIGARISEDGTGLFLTNGTQATLSKSSLSMNSDIGLRAGNGLR